MPRSHVWIEGVDKKRRRVALEVLEGHGTERRGFAIQLWRRIRGAWVAGKILGPYRVRNRAFAAALRQMRTLARTQQVDWCAPR